MRLLITLLLGLVFVRVASAAPVTPKPNIVLIFIDDMGYGDIGPFGSKLNRTPNLDRMAGEGMKLTSFYAAPVCSVSRAQVITGCYGARVSVPGVFPPGSPHGLSSDEHTVAELLKAQGYSTMCIGKWHLGDQPQFLPTRHGFDHYFGIPYSNDMLRPAAVNGQRVVPLVRNERVEQLLSEDDEDGITARYTDEAVKFINAQNGTPFFLYLAHNAVHTPIHPGANFRGKSQNGRYGDWVEEVDWSVGRVLDTLRDRRLDQNTLVIFSSDNGPWLIKGTDGGTAGPLRGGKGTTWEGGVREPTIAWWPGKVAARSVCDAVAGNIDFLPTFVKLAGGSVPADRVIDGRDISPLLFGESTESPHEAHYYYAGYKLQAVRAGPWKLAVAPQGEGRSKAGPAVFASVEHPRLYNLDSDIGERTDVAAAHPEVVARLALLARKSASELGDGQPGRAVRPAGFVQNATTLYPTQDGKKAAVKEEAIAAHVSAPLVQLSAMKIGDSLPAAKAPQIVGKPLVIACEVEPKAPDGVIVSHGGAAVGYAVYLKDGHVVFAISKGRDGVTRASSRDVVSGPFSMQAKLAGDGTMTLTINGQQVAQARTAGPIARQPAEEFCVGHDAAKTVDHYDGRTLFKGAISKLTIVTD